MDKLKLEIFNRLVKILKPFEKKLKHRTDGKTKYELSGKKKVVVGKKEFESMFFAAVIIQKGFTGFYFFPVYTHVKEFKSLPDNLKKCLKGKSCFHIKKNDEELLAEFKQLVKKGYDIYKKAGWV
jgi:hypothetical protein